MKKNILILHCLALAEMPEEALRAVAFLQAGSSFSSLIPGQIVSNLPSVYKEFLPKSYDSIPSSQTREFYADVCVDNKRNPQAVNVLGLIKFFGFGSLGYNIVDGQPDYYHPRLHVRWNFGSTEPPYFGHVPDSGQYSLNQRALYWLLNNLPHENGTIEILFQHGEIMAIMMDSDDYLCISKQE